MSCPKCKSEEPFIIIVVCSAMVYDDGIDRTWDTEWDGKNSCTCYACGHFGPVESFTTKGE
jgi:hypothetical protein